MLHYVPMVGLLWIEHRQQVLETCLIPLDHNPKDASSGNWTHLIQVKSLIPDLTRLSMQVKEDRVGFEPTCHLVKSQSLQPDWEYDPQWTVRDSNS